MTELVEGQEGQEQVENKEEVTLSPVEQKAIEQGWVPQDQWEGDPDQWRPAKEFLDRGELFKKIDDQNRTIKEFKRALEDMKAHNAKIRETEYARALKELKEQRKAALVEGDIDRVTNIEDEIDMVKTEQSKLQSEPVVESQEPHPEFVAWVNENKWYEKDEGMRGYADSIGRSLANRGMTPSEVLKEVTKKVKEEFKHKFVNPNREKPGTVESGSHKGSSTRGGPQLTQEERRVMERLVRTGALTEKEYIAQIAEYNKRRGE